MADVDETLPAARVAKAEVNSSAVDAMCTGMQVFGGITQTWAHVAHLYLRRILSGAIVLATTTDPVLLNRGAPDAPSPGGGQRRVGGARRTRRPTGRLHKPFPVIHDRHAEFPVPLPRAGNVRCDSDHAVQRNPFLALVHVSTM
ncbi:hypothetical protein [Streptomyces sp. 3214.6]|uniref:hypothetical protein n=1 Tax=Streptomyces sp. 3214.6 TaxID=1882757 RepID=UPI0018D55043|nr:hypothetical protein [Streptomyces sp. 3214.6]